MCPKHQFFVAFRVFSGLVLDQKISISVWALDADSALIPETFSILGLTVWLGVKKLQILSILNFYRLWKFTSSSRYTPSSTHTLSYSNHIFTSWYPRSAQKCLKT